MNQLLAVFSFLVIGQASAQASVKDFLPQIMNQVRQCAVVPVSYNANGGKTVHAMISHCPEVKVINPNLAMIEAAGRSFTAAITESPDSDGGDLYQLVITDNSDQDHLDVNNVLAFGDVLLAVLMGNATGVTETDLQSIKEPVGN